MGGAGLRRDRACPAGEGLFFDKSGEVGHRVGETGLEVLHDLTGGYGVVVLFAASTMVVPISLFVFVPELRKQ